MNESARCEIRVPGKTSNGDERLDGMIDTLAASDIDPFSEAFLTDPYPYHEQLRENGPVTYLDRYGVYAVARHADVVAVFSDFDA